MPSRCAKRRVPQADALHMELTPMIDIVFNLLIFFMLQKFQTTEGIIQAYLPKQAGKGDGARLTCVLDVRVKCLWVDAAGKPVTGPGGHAVLELGDVPLSQPGELDGPGLTQHPAWAQLSERLERIKASYIGGAPSGLPVIIDARPEVPTQVVVLALNEVVRAGIQDVRFAAPEKPY